MINASLEKQVAEHTSIYGVCADVQRFLNDLIEEASFVLSGILFKAAKLLTLKAGR